MAKPQKIIDPITRREFRSLRALAIYHGFKPGVIAARLRLQWSLLHALRTPVAPNHCGHSSDRRPRKVTYKGVTYPSQRALIDALGVNPGTFYHRRAAGDSLERALRPAYAEHRGRQVTYEGVWYPTLKAFAGALGLPPAKAKILLDEEAV